MIDPDFALQLVLDAASSLDPKRIPIHNATGLVLTESIVADRDYPPFSRSMMDGYAVCCADAGKAVAVMGEVAAGMVSNLELTPGNAIEIMTGAPCPSGTEAVIQKELVERSGDRVTLPGDIPPGQNIARTGTECARGAAVLSKGDLLAPLAIASAATFGIIEVKVYPRPSIAIITTGDELVPIDQQPGPAQIRNSNGIMLATMAQKLGLDDVTQTHAVDQPESLAECLERAEVADIIILSGAVSAGKYDGVPDALAAFGATPVFHKVTQRPGKPIFFATRGRQLIFGLPGNPLSCHLGFHRYVAPAAKRMMGVDTPRPVLHGILTDSIVVKGSRTVFQLAVARHESNDWYVAPCKGRGSADMYSAARANALIRFEPDSGEVRGGTTVSFELLD
jgi:molybdopterin molybdotransferase